MRRRRLPPSEAARGSIDLGHERCHQPMQRPLMQGDEQPGKGKSPEQDHRPGEVQVLIDRQAGERRDRCGVSSILLAPSPLHPSSLWIAPAPSAEQPRHADAQAVERNHRPRDDQHVAEIRRGRDRGSQDNATEDGMFEVYR